MRCSEVVRRVHLYAWIYGGSLLAIAAWLAWTALRAIRSQCMPPPGSWIIEGQRTHVGDDAVRRGRILLCCAVVLALGRWRAVRRAVEARGDRRAARIRMSAGREALRRLREGNGRFVAGASSNDARISAARRAELAVAQRPFAIVLGCSDSRVPVEIVFDQGPGDLFVIRVAGNIVAPSLIGSVEFAAAQFGTPLVVVLGHSQCGAILATLDQLRRPTCESVAQPEVDRRPDPPRRREPAGRAARPRSR